MKGREIMNKKIKSAALALCAASVFSLCSFTAAASTDAVHQRREAMSLTQERSAPIAFERYELSVSKIYNKSIWAYSSVAATLNGKQLASDVRMINGTPYVALRSFINETTDMTVTYKSQAKTLNIKGKGLEMDVIDGGNVIYANGRTLFSMSPSVIMTNGRMYAPLNLIAKALGFSFYRSTATGAYVLTGSVKPLTHGNTYYNSDAVYWLSRIISAESRGESLLGQIAVGSVVMNRVKSPLYPNTIWGVIFDRKYGVQFSPILDGSIYNAPTSSAVVAAKICLEGFNVNQGALFFLYPRASTSSWIPNNRTYLFSIGKHDFYA